MKVICSKECFYAGRRWKAGEVKTIKDGDAIPAHFVPESGANIEKPRALSPEEIAEAVGGIMTGIDNKKITKLPPNVGAVHGNDDFLG